VKEGTSRTRREFGRFVRFSIVGAIGAAVDFGTFNLLTTVIGLWSILASALSFTAAVTSNFLFNRFWVYPDSRSKAVGRQVVQFALVNLVGLIIRTPVFALSEGPFIRTATSFVVASLGRSGGLAGAAAGANPVILGRNAALALAVVVVLFWNFFANRVWTFSDVS
jgi:putative flippase GtrA